LFAAHLLEGKFSSEDFHRHYDKQASWDAILGCNREREGSIEKERIITSELQQHTPSMERGKLPSPAAKPL
jgi:hypothetical protein